MDEFMREIKKLSETEILLDVHIANTLQEKFGWEVGTLQNLTNSKSFLEEYIRQADCAVQVLDDEKHEFPKEWLKGLKLNLELVLGQVQKRLDSGDYRM